MKKKGFTIIELVVAVAILFIGITAYGMASSGAMQSYKANKTKIANLNFADTVINIFKANGKLLSQSIYEKNAKDTNGNVSYYFYYDNLDELEAELNVSPPTKLVSASVLSADIGTFGSCKTANSSGKKNGAFISISKVNEVAGHKIFDTNNIGSNYNINMYGLLIKTWNFDYGGSSEVKLKIYLGR